MRRELSSKDFAGEEGRGTPINCGGSRSFPNCEAPGKWASSASSLMGGPDCTKDDFGRSSSFTTDWRFLSRSSSSSSSVISINRLRRSELVEEDVEPDAAWSEQAADSLVSFSSFESAIEKVVSWGENRSQTSSKWTVTRAAKRLGELLCSREARGAGPSQGRREHTLN